MKKRGYVVKLVGRIPSDMPFDVMVEGRQFSVLRGSWEERGAWLHFTTLFGEHFTIPMDSVREILSFNEEETLWVHPQLRQ
ncbi:MAG: hypothetical protein UY54_C0015G0021 [Parcubacteria group bacterium GW2011_GWA2_50_10b]|nr:MAG: hypothetical protein UY54_C0015G0021 [Parcubacteria group bacterium GW2011_GWA2_50_10b]